MHSKICLLGAFVLGISISYGQLQWDANQKEFHPTLKEKSLVAEFPFTNVGDRVVTITEIKPSCGCTTTELSKKVYQPGEAGKIAATFDFGKRQGLQVKTIDVKTDDPASAPTTLTLKVHLPEFLSMAPNFVWWKVGEEKSPKSISLKVLQEEPLKILSVKSLSDRLVPELKTVQEGKEYSIAVSPVDTTEPVRTVLVIEAEFASGDKRSFHAFSHIR